MVIDLLAVFDDGVRPLDPNIPLDLRRALAFSIGETVTIRAKILTAAGSPYRSIAGDVLTLTVRTPAAPGQRRLFQKTGTKATNLADGTYVFSVAPGDTATLGDVRRGILDIKLVRSGASFVLFPASTLTLGN